MASMYDFSTKSLDILKDEFEKAKDDAVKANAIADESYRLLVLKLQQEDERQNASEPLSDLEQDEIDDAFDAFDAFDWGSRANSRPVTPLHSEVMAAESPAPKSRHRRSTPDAILDTSRVPMCYSRVVRDDVDRSTFYVTWYERNEFRTASENGAIYAWVRSYPSARFHTLQRRELLRYFAVDAPLDLPLVVF